MGIGCSKSRLIEYEQGLCDSDIIFNLNVPNVLINVILTYLDESNVSKLHIINSTHYLQIDINYLIDEYWNRVNS